LRFEVERAVDDAHAAPADFALHREAASKPPLTLRLDAVVPLHVGRRG
jgi:hypothetical protein